MQEIEDAGLYTEGGAVPLQGVAISVEVIDVASKVTVVQRYRNEETKPVEATYCFPLEQGSAVCGFEVQIGDRLIRGEVEEREKAFERYDEAMLRGYGAMLLDQEKPNIFVVSVGNLNPGQEAVISITYVAELRVSDDHIRLMIPTTVSPRYVPSDADPVKADIVSPPLALQVPYGLSLEVCIGNGAAIASVTSPSHKIGFEQRENDWNVTLADSDGRLDRDFILLVGLKDPGIPFARIQQHENGDRAIMFRLYPEFDHEEQNSPSEVIFLLDCSGSMSGSSIAQAKRALELCLRTLSEGDRFNLVRFGSTFEALFKASADYTDESLEQAARYVRDIDADLGGTKIYPALKHILEEMPHNSSHKCELMVLTDGEVLNEEDVVALARKHRDRVRIFSFGIGYGASESLIRGLARVTRGAAEFISPDEGIEDKVLRQFSRLATPVITDLAMDWKGMGVRQAPLEIPPVFSGDSLSVYGLVENGSMADEVTLSGTMGGKVVSWPLTLSGESRGDLIPTLWARNHIRDLEEGAGLEGGSRQRDRKISGVKNTLVEIGKRFHLMSSQTSFVAVETRSDAERPTEQAEYRRIPIQLTRDWHGVPAYATCYESYFADTVSLGSVSQPVEPARSWVYDLLLVQGAAGYFRGPTRKLARQVNRGVKDLQWLAERVEGVEARLREKVLATALTVAVLESEGREFEDQWKGAVEKARGWLAREARDAKLDGRPILEVLSEAISGDRLELPSTVPVAS